MMETKTKKFPPKKVPCNSEELNPSKNEWDLTNGPLSKLLELLDTQV